MDSCDGEKKLEVDQPHMLRVYNKHMGSVDYPMCAIQCTLNPAYCERSRPRSLQSREN